MSEANDKTISNLDKVYQSQSNNKEFVSENFGTICQLLINRQSQPAINRPLIEQP